MPGPASCPRCRTRTRANGSDWCCWELDLLENLMRRDEPPTLHELLTVHFIGRSEHSLVGACVRYGFKRPRIDGRRNRCRGCRDLHHGAGVLCASCAAMSSNERVSA